jgi:arsenite methyltransferase
VSGVDLTTEMLAPPQAAVDRLGQQHLEFRVASIEALPYEDRSFDLAISNGVLNMIPDKKSAFSELARILKPDGTLVAPDLLVMEDIPEEVLASKDAWSA